MQHSAIRSLQRVIPAVESRDGDGVKIQRIAGRDLQVQMDPFLMLDEIRSDDAADYIGGFPPHPHRGFETITYMLQGRLRHRDHLGNEGVVGPGGAQWMTAGRGIIHSEMPEQEDGLMHGFQLWLNLPATEKMRPASWRDVRSEEMAQAQSPGGGSISLLAGKLEMPAGGHTIQLQGPIQTVTEAVLADLRLAAGSAMRLCLPQNHTVLVYVVAGRLRDLARGQMGVYRDGAQLQLEAEPQADVRLLLLAGRPLREPIAQHGPFVMNSMEEIEQAMTQYREGRLV